MAATRPHRGDRWRARPDTTGAAVSAAPPRRAARAAVAAAAALACLGGLAGVIQAGGADAATLDSSAWSADVTPGSPLLAEAKADPRVAVPREQCGRFDPTRSFRACVTVRGRTVMGRTDLRPTSEIARKGIPMWITIKGPFGPDGRPVALNDPDALWNPMDLVSDVAGYPQRATTATAQGLSPGYYRVAASAGHSTSVDSPLVRIS